jgi:hypothetical protein
MSAARQPWLLFMPDGTWDGLIWSPESEDEAGQRLFRTTRAWRAAKAKGWTIRLGVDDEHRRLLADRMHGSKAARS